MTLAEKLLYDAGELGLSLLLHAYNSRFNLYLVQSVEQSHSAI